MNYNDALLNNQPARSTEPEETLKSNFPDGEATKDRADEIIFYVVDHFTGLTTGQADTYDNAMLMKAPHEWIKRVAWTEKMRQEEGRRRRQGNRMGDFTARTNV